MLCKTFFEDNISFVGGEGSRLKFWEEKWLYKVQLKTISLALYED